MRDEDVFLKKINLLPWREEYKEFQRKQFIFFLGLSVVASILMVVGLHLFFSQEINKQLARNNYLIEETEKIDKQIIEIESLKKEKEKLLNRMETIQKLQTERLHIVKLFEGIVKTVPDGLYLTYVNRVKNKIMIQGKAESNIRVSELMRNIETSSWITNPMLSVIEAEDNKDKKENEFKIEEKEMLFNLEATQIVKEE